MSGNDAPLHYWNTCLFLAWMNDEQRGDGWVEILVGTRLEYVSREQSRFR